jgi:hypothetical protein
MEKGPRGLKKRGGACLNAESSITRSQSPWGSVPEIREARCGYVCVFEDYIYSQLLSATPDLTKWLVLSKNSNDLGKRGQQSTRTRQAKALSP